MDQNNNASNNSTIPTSSTPGSNAIEPSGSQSSVTPPLTPAPKIADSGGPGKSRVFVAAGSHKKAFILGALVVFLLVGGLVTSLFLVQKNQDIRGKAFEIFSNPKDDTCSIVLVNISEKTSCPKLENNTGQNNVSNYQTVYTITNPARALVDSSPGVAHKVKYVKNSNFCDEPYGQKGSTSNPICLSNPQQETVEVTLQPGESVDIPINRASPTGSACGSYQTDFSISSIDGNTSCHGRTGGTPPDLVNAGVCQTGITCGAISSPTTAVCQLVSPDKDLTKIKIGDTITFSGWGQVSSDKDKIDKINFIILKDGQPLTGGDTTVDTVRDTSKDSGTLMSYKGTQTFKITDPGKYDIRIRTHWLKDGADGGWKE